jgi:3-isopropylmalate/(R)-2-methylmalate dehydratase large subunit
LREFARRNQIQHHYDVGTMGIEHALLPEKGLVAPGELIVAGDSHTCTYGALGAFATGMGSTDIAAAMALGRVWLKVPESILCVFEGALKPFVTGKDLILWLIGQHGVDGAQYKTLEFRGSTISALGMDDRFALCNMGVEAGAKNAIIPPDGTSAAYLADRVGRGYTAEVSDPDATYAQVWQFESAQLRPVVAQPFSPGNVTPVRDLPRTEVDQVIIGSCTNGRLSDLRQAARILEGRRVAAGVRLIVVPASQEVTLQALREGIIETLVSAGAAVSTPTCGPCFGGHMGVLADGEVCLSTTNRNFRGRMGGVESRVYLGSPYTAAATAVAGYICTPEEVL